jgi:hypothetical protein
MYVTKPFIALLAAASTAQAFDKFNVDHLAPSNEKRSLRTVIEGVRDTVSNLIQRQGSCPPVWQTVRDTLTAQFLLNGECTDAARAAIRGGKNISCPWRLSMRQPSIVKYGSLTEIQPSTTASMVHATAPSSSPMNVQIPKIKVLHVCAATWIPSPRITMLAMLI